MLSFMILARRMGILFRALVVVGVVEVGVGTDESQVVEWECAVPISW
jgi:hypothetical protein